MLAAGVHGWHARLAAVHREEGREEQRWLVNHEANRSGEAGVGALLGDERPCLGDVGRMVWRVWTYRSD